MVNCACSVVLHKIPLEQDLASQVSVDESKEKLVGQNPNLAQGLLTFTNPDGNKINIVYNSVGFEAGLGLPQEIPDAVMDILKMAFR